MRWWDETNEIGLWETYTSAFWIHGKSLVAQGIKNLPEMQETQVESLEKEMATHSGILAWRISWTEEPDWLQSIGSQQFRHDWAINTIPTILLLSPKQLICKMVHAKYIGYDQHGNNKSHSNQNYTIS